MTIDILKALPVFKNAVFKKKLLHCAKKKIAAMAKMPKGTKPAQQNSNRAMRHASLSARRPKSIIKVSLW